ncbi:hypothetical protein N9W41_00595 [bacterium]|nr:hypothetical protein [bacterium]
MKYILMILTIFSAMQVFGSTPNPDLMGFNTWKLKQVIEAQNKLTKIKNQEVLSEHENMRVPKTISSIAAQQEKELEKQKLKAKRRLDLAKELSFSDYLDVYVGRYSDNEQDLKELAKKMDTDQVVELLKNYSSQKK